MTWRAIPSVGTGSDSWASPKTMKISRYNKSKLMGRTSTLVIGLAAMLLSAGAFQTAARQPATAQAPQSSSNTLSHGIETQRSNGSIVKTDRTGKGAVLCTWGIFEAARAAGRECYNGQDPAFQAELDSSISRIDGFIIKNSMHPVTKAGLAARRLQGLQQIGGQENLCRGDAAKIYEVLRSRGVLQLRVQTTELLSIPREPVTNPCL